jgi:uncharacterized protein (DUF924 family)
MTEYRASDVVGFWRAAGPDEWFEQRSGFDEEFRRRFLEPHEHASGGHLDAWVDHPEGAMALMILLDQFPRNAFRGSARMYATDELARRYADRALQAGFDERVDAEMRLFFYLPFAHSERLEDQDRSVALHSRIGYLENARRHRDIIRRFGRFPHRNPILGRPMTPEEQAFLDAGGFAG